MTNWYGSLVWRDILAPPIYVLRELGPVAERYDPHVQILVESAKVYILLSFIRHRDEPRNHTACVIYSSRRQQANNRVRADMPCGAVPTREIVVAVPALLEM